MCAPASTEGGISSEKLALKLPAGGLNVDATLASGQSFCWREDAGHWMGWIGDTPVEVWLDDDGSGRNCGNPLTSGRLCCRWLGPNGIEPEAVESYFGLDDDLPAMIDTLPRDEHLAKALSFAPGLRILRQDRWETTANFICSSLKQIVQIAAINAELRRSFGRSVVPGLHDYPSAETLAEAGEGKLRACKLGYRARHLARAARQVAEGEVDLSAVAGLATPEARTELMRLGGIGEKVANCILLFAYHRLEAFPIDVWVERALTTLYFPRRRKPFRRGELADFAADYFGPFAGLAQQYLFHWVRTGGVSTPSPGGGRQSR